MWLKSLERHSDKLELLIWISQANQILEARRRAGQLLHSELSLLQPQISLFQNQRCNDGADG